MEEKNTNIIFIENTENDTNSFIRLSRSDNKFEFRLQNGNSKTEGHCDLTEEECAVFDAVFMRMVTNFVQE